jgi:hypothetical protein
VTWCTRRLETFLDLPVYRLNRSRRSRADFLVCGLVKYSRYLPVTSATSMSFRLSSVIVVSVLARN